MLDGIRMAGAGEPQIKVTFNIDANGIVNVSAEDLDTGKEQSITITMSSGLTDEEIKRMARESMAYEIKLKGQEQTDGLSQQVEVLLHRVTKEFDKKSYKLDGKFRNDIAKLLDRAPGFLRLKDVGKLRILENELRKLYDNLKRK